MKLPVCSVILAAGTSTRMGKSKQLLLLDKRPILEHCIYKCMDLPLQKVMVIIGHHAEDMKQAININDHRLQWVINEDYRKGQSSSFQLAVKEMGKEYTSFLVFLGDQPFIGKQTINRIYQLGIEQLQRFKNPFVIQPFYKKEPGHPVFFGNFNKETLSLVKGDTGAKKLIDQCMHRIKLDLDDPFVVFDIDTPNDYTIAVEMLQTTSRDETER
jgi:molybdenum cofactor cytidylyltransferase